VALVDLERENLKQRHGYLKSTPLEALLHDVAVQTLQNLSI
jgi:hypothetical protein